MFSPVGAVDDAGYTLSSGQVVYNVHDYVNLDMGTDELDAHWVPDERR